MGRHDLRPLRVHKAATQLLGTEKLCSTPSWFNVVGKIPPAQTLVRTQPLQHQEPKQKRNTKKPSKLFQPTNIVYEEDSLRKTFFGDHPWELARPRVVLENDGKDAKRYDWSHMEQPNKVLDGERFEAGAVAVSTARFLRLSSVIQRQLWLQRNSPGITRAQAYDRARQEFYDLRLQEDIERRVAKEEALATGAYFGKSTLQIGMDLEDKSFEQWKGWGRKEVIALEQKRSSAYTGNNNEPSEFSADDPEIEAAVDELSDSVPAQGQDAYGGALVRP